MLELLLVRGLPGAGKSYFAMQKSQELGYSHIEADMFVPRVDGRYTWVKEDSWLYHAKCQQSVMYKLLLGKSCIVSNTFITYYEMLPYIEIAYRTKAKLSTHICRGNYDNLHFVPIEVVEMMKSKWEE